MIFLHEIIKGADPAHLVFEGDAVVTYGELEKTVARYRNTLYEMGVRHAPSETPESGSISCPTVHIPVNDGFVLRHAAEYASLLECFSLLECTFLLEYAPPPNTSYPVPSAILSRAR